MRCPMDEMTAAKRLSRMTERCTDRPLACVLSERRRQGGGPAPSWSESCRCALNVSRPQRNPTITIRHPQYGLEFSRTSSPMRSSDATKKIGKALSTSLVQQARDIARGGFGRSRAWSVGTFPLFKTIDSYSLSSRHSRVTP